MLNTVAVIGWTVYANIASAPDRVVTAMKRLNSDRRGGVIMEHIPLLIGIGLALVILAAIFIFTRSATSTIGNATQTAANNGANAVNGLG